MKTSFITEAETVNAGRKFTTRDTMQVGGHMEKLLRQKQGRDAHTERRRVGNRPREEECSQKADTSFILGNSSGTLSSFRPIIWFLFLHLTCPGSLSWGVHEPFSQDGSSSEGFWEEQDALWPGITP